MADDTEKDNDDYLGYGVYADTLWSRIEAALNKDVAHREAALREAKEPPPLGEDPLVVGLFGEWGAGKSKLLSLIQKRAEAQRNQQVLDHKLNGYQAITVPVFFQPWKYEHEKHLLLPLLMHILVELENTLAKARNGEDKATGAALAVVQGTKNVLSRAAKKVGDLSQAVGQVMGVAGPVASAPMAAMAQLLAHGLGDMLSSKAKRVAAREFAHADNGRSYYEMHRILSEVTRPAKHPHVTDDQHHDKDFCLNFVIFIDDLDRCLPEKAVETLELIKTVFNLESFAFVLALDEEVVERGIGHRYKDYALQNKKPEMPITGFEYLEKIVHLPFRLPALSRQEGLKFLEEYERSLLEGRKFHRRPSYEPLSWFSMRDFAVAVQDTPQVRMVPMTDAKGAAEGAFEAWSARSELAAAGGVLGCHLGHAVLNGFDAYVPRKLIRVVELFHQVVEVAHERGRPVDAHLGGERDPRWVLVFVMLQLFQPDLFRLLRRLGRGVDTLRDAFAEKSLRADMADMELLNWACYGAKPIPTDLQAAIEAIANNQDEGVRYPAQRIRLPIVERLLEHRAAQRHVFDPLKLFAGLMDPKAPFATGNTRAYFSLLSRVAGESDELRMLDVAFALQDGHGDGAGVAMNDKAPGAEQQGDPEQWVDVDLERLFLSLISAEASERRALAETLGLQPGQRLRTVQAQEVAQRLEAWLSEATALSKIDRLARASDGLSYLAPFVAAGDGQALWKALGVSDVQWEPKAPYADTTALKTAANQADLFVALGQDQRFNPELFHLPFKNVKGHSFTQEPVAGFVRIPAGPFTLGAKGEGFEDNPPRPDTPIGSDFYIARYLTTVDQYAHFVADQGYGHLDGERPAWWDTLGWQWRTGQWDSLIKEKVYREHLASRKTELRGEPMQWAVQQAHGSRPVVRINWFEARAYARWLTLRLQEKNGLLPAGYAVRLPTEAQWERAARAKSVEQADAQRQYPWAGKDATTAHLHANMRESGIKRVSPVGLFSPNPLGLCDMSGNVWEWQNNLYRPDGSEQDKSLITDVIDLRTDEDWEKCDLPALRGGAWNITAEDARASVRNWNPPDDWSYYVGFRVVLSLPN